MVMAYSARALADVLAAMLASELSVLLFAAKDIGDLRLIMANYQVDPGVSVNCFPSGLLLASFLRNILRRATRTDI